MAGMCCGVMGETETAAPVEPSSKSARRRRMELHQFNFVPTDDAVAPPMESGGRRKRPKMDNVVVPVSTSRKCAEGNQNWESKDGEKGLVKPLVGEKGMDATSSDLSASSSKSGFEAGVAPELPKFGTTSVCGRRRDMEDSVAVHHLSCSRNANFPGGINFFGVYDGHGCSHVSTRCKDRMHEIVKGELESSSSSAWEQVMLESFSKMDKDVAEMCSAGGAGVSVSACRCELRTPQCEAVGSTAVVVLVTQDKIIVSNCGDSRAVLCRNGVAIPLSMDHKPDRPDELNRIQEAGGRVIDWDGARVLGVLAMSRAIGDNYLKPYVISEPEISVTERTPEDECLILASDGLWDVVSNETACGVARKCLQSCKTPSPPRSPLTGAAAESSDKACSDASILLTKLALARHSSDNVSVVVVNLQRQ